MNVPVSKLAMHPGQMRTRTAVGALAQLAVQMIRPDSSFPLVVRRGEGDGFVVISGHRRWLAAMIAHVTPDQTLDGMFSTIERCCNPQEGFVTLTPELYQLMVDHVLGVSNFTLPTVEWDGEQGSEILSLIRANMGNETPDLLGMLHCLASAVDAGSTVEELAGACGWPPAQVQAVLDIQHLPDKLAGLLQDGQLDLELVPHLVGLSKKQVKGVEKALLESIDNPRGNWTVYIQLAVTTLTGLPSPTPPPRNELTSEYANRMLVTRLLLEQAMAKHPMGLAYAVTKQALSGSSGRSIYENYLRMMADVEGCQEYITTVDHYKIMLTDKALSLLPEGASCQCCHFAQLPQDHYLKHELEIPCRKRKGLPELGRCWSWAPQNEPLTCRTPYYWHEGGKEVNSFKALLAEWQKQRGRESRQSQTVVGGPEDSEEVAPIDKQRESIRFYMERHLLPPFTVDHPWATSCATCKHHLEKSPVKSDPDAPHCRWARNRQSLVYEARIPAKEEGELPWIPFCFQYAPAKSWAEIIPASVDEPAFPRQMLLALILAIGKSANHNVYSVTSRGVVQWLTGRPDLASGNHRRLFEERLAVEAEALSDRQLWTLFQWVMLEWYRAHESVRSGPIPLKDGRLAEYELDHFGTVVEEEGE